MDKQKKKMASDKWRKANPEKVKESCRKSYEKDRERIIARQREYNAKNKERIAANQKAYRQRLIAEGKIVPKPRVYVKKTPKVKPITKTQHVVQVERKPKTSTKMYLHNSDLLYHTILSQGRGKVSNELLSMWMKMIDGIAKKFPDNELARDSKQDCLIHLYTQYHLCNTQKYTDVFPYFSEVIKRQFAKNYNNWFKMKPVSINKLFNV